jgi:hypothetical protein
VNGAVGGRSLILMQPLIDPRLAFMK